MTRHLAQFPVPAEFSYSTHPLPRGGTDLTAEASISSVRFATRAEQQGTRAEQEAAIAAAAKELDELRSVWLNPPEWTREEILEFPGSVAGPWARYVSDANERSIGTVRYPHLIPKDDTAAERAHHIRAGSGSDRLEAQPEIARGLNVTSRTR